jgi:hypothetical protein
MVEVQLHAEHVIGKPEIARVNCCYQAITLRTPLWVSHGPAAQKMPTAGPPASGSVAQGRGVER